MSAPDGPVEREAEQQERAWLDLMREEYEDDHADNLMMDPDTWEDEE